MVLVLELIGVYLYDKPLRINFKLGACKHNLTRHLCGILHTQYCQLLHVHFVRWQSGPRREISGSLLLVQFVSICPEAHRSCVSKLTHVASSSPEIFLQGPFCNISHLTNALLYICSLNLVNEPHVSMLLNVAFFQPLWTCAYKSSSYLLILFQGTFPLWATVKGDIQQLYGKAAKQLQNQNWMHSFVFGKPSFLNLITMG